MNQVKETAGRGGRVKSSGRMFIDLTEKIIVWLLKWIKKYFKARASRRSECTYRSDKKNTVYSIAYNAWKTAFQIQVDLKLGKTVLIYWTAGWGNISSENCHQRSYSTDPPQLVVKDNTCPPPKKYPHAALWKYFFICWVVIFLFFKCCTVSQSLFSYFEYGSFILPRGSFYVGPLVDQGLSRYLHDTL